MLKFRRAVFCYYILGFDRALHSWLLLMSESLLADGWLSIGDANRERLAAWIVDMFTVHVDFEVMMHTLAGDAFFEQNKRDVAKLERDMGKKVTELWDTHPVFAKYPRLRGLARNKEFEAMWAKMKAGKKEKQK